MPSSQYACLNTKIQAMRASMLSDQDYRQMIKAPDFNSLFQYLCTNTIYGDYLSDIDTSHLHREIVENALNKHRITSIEKLMHYTSREDKKLLQLFFVKQDVENLISIIRKLMRGGSFENADDFLMIAQNHSSLPVRSLVLSSNWEEFKKKLVKTDFYRVLEVYPSLTTNLDLYDIEKSLERYYYDEQKRILRKVNGQKSKESLIKVFRKEVDVLNLIWFYRNIKFYHLPREQLIAYAYRGGLRVEASDIERFAGSKNIDAYLTMINDAKFNEYAFLFSHGLSNDLYMERRRERYLFYAFKRLFLSDNSGIGKAIAFVRLIEYEINDIVSIIESKRYHMRQDEAEAFLIHQFEEEREGLTDGN